MILERLGRSNAPIIGKYVKTAFVTDRKRDEWVFPINQAKMAKHPRHPQGFHANGRQLCVSPSCSFYKDLCKYSDFRWSQS